MAQGLRMVGNRVRSWAANPLPSPAWSSTLALGRRGISIAPGERERAGTVGKELPHGNVHDGAIVVKGGAAGLSHACKGAESNESLSFNTTSRFNSSCGSHVKRPLGAFFTCKKPASLVNVSSFTVSQRHFATKSSDDEEVVDDVEARLMREDDNRDGMFMGDSGYGLGGASVNDYHEDQFGEDSSWAMDGENVQMADGEGGISDEDSDDTGNEMSDEEFEGERTDEELDELLANTPLFEPPLVEDMGAHDVDFSFRPEGPSFYPGMEYEPEDLDITRPLPPRRREPRPKEVVSVEEVIDKADFRNVRYLCKFIGETGNILARKEFKMRNKSHGRITKAIKTARFFGLMPYTNMGRPRYVFNEPFDEFSEFYETDDDERKLQDITSGTNYEGRIKDTIPREGGFRRFPQRRGGFSGQGGFGGQGMGQRL
eukprot:c23688_g1_i1 orf=533-1819(-)